MSECTSCPSNEKCSKDKQRCMIENNPKNNVGKIIGVMSGKGGVGKSSISVLIAKHLNSLGYRVGVLDADITGPSIPRLMNLKDTKCIAVDNMMIPAKTIDGIKVMSLNLMIKNENDPVIWRGPMIAGAVKQFWTDTLWEELDYLIIDMPPGTGDVALTVMQSIPLNGIVMVSVPQDFVSMIVDEKVDVIITGSLGSNVFEIIEKAGIKAYKCDNIDINSVLDKYKNNELFEINTAGASHYGPIS